MLHQVRISLSSSIEEKHTRIFTPIAVKLCLSLPQCLFFFFFYNFLCKDLSSLVLDLFQVLHILVVF